MKSFFACRLIPLDRKPGLRPIGVEEVLQRIAGKAVIMLFKNEVTHAAAALQFSAGQDAGVQAVVRTMHDIFSEENTEVVLLIDAEDTFISINRKLMLHNIIFYFHKFLLLYKCFFIRKPFFCLSIDFLNIML